MFILIGCLIKKVGRFQFGIFIWIWYNDSMGDGWWCVVCLGILVVLGWFLVRSWGSGCGDKGNDGW